MEYIVVSNAKAKREGPEQKTRNEELRAKQRKNRSLPEERRG
jgi:hypothetical protein